MSTPRMRLLPSIPNGIPITRKLAMVCQLTDGVLSGGMYSYDYKNVELMTAGCRMVDVWFKPGQLPPAATLSQNTDLMVWENI